MASIFLLVNWIFLFDSFFGIVRMNVGEIVSVENTPNDFRTLTRIGDRIDEVPFAYSVMFIIDGEGNRSFGK